MHASALGAHPPVCYLLPETLRLIEGLRREREHGLAAYFTLDAGPNPVLVCLEAEADRVARWALSQGARETRICVPGGDARILS